MNILNPTPADASSNWPKLPTEQLNGQATISGPTASEVLAEKAIPAAQAMVPEASPVTESAPETTGTAPVPEVTTPEVASSSNTIPNDTVGKPDYLLPAQQPQEATPQVDATAPQQVPAAPAPAEAPTPPTMPPTPTDTIEGASI